MNWKQSDLRKLLVWFCTFFEEDNGKASTKRIIAWIMGIGLFKMILHIIKDIPISNWNDSIYILGTIFGMICTLLTISYIPTRKD